MTDLPLTGGCNCGAVRYEVTEPLVVASYCHCKRCQRRSGAAASANAHPAPGAFKIVAGEDRLRVWKPEDGGEKWFCGDCGSAMFGRNPSHADPSASAWARSTRIRDPPERPPVRGLRRGLGADPRRRPAALPREPSRAQREHILAIEDLARRARSRSADRTRRVNPARARPRSAACRSPAAFAGSRPRGRARPSPGPGPAVEHR